MENNLEQSVDQQPQSIQQQPISEIPPKSNFKLILLIIVILILVGSVAFYFGTKQNKPLISSENQNLSQASKTSTNLSKRNKGIYFGKGFDGKYSFVNIDSGEIKELIPAGYAIVSQHDYGIFPDYFILQKDNDLFSFNLEDKLLNKVFGQLALPDDLKLNKDEQVSIYPSITEKSKFYIVINKYDPNAPPGGLESQSSAPVGTRSYFFDALINRLEKTRDIEFGNFNCYKYDSKNVRFITYTCGGNVGFTLSAQDLNGNNLRNIFYGLSKDGFSPASVRYSNGTFMILEGTPLSKITVIDPAQTVPTEDIYTVSNDVKAQLSKTSFYSGTIDTTRNTIAIGENSSILLLKFNDNKQIIESKYIPDKEIYANFIFPYDGKIFYKSVGSLRIINLESWQIEKSIPLQGENEEITLISK